MMKQTQNLILCRIISLLFLIMLVRYHMIFSLIRDPAANVFTTVIVVLFYVLNITCLTGLFFAKSWGFITSYFAIPISTFLFATSYLSFITDWIPISISMYIIPAVNALLLIGIVSLQVQRHRLKNS